MAALPEDSHCSYLAVNEEEEERGREIVGVSDKGGFGSRRIVILEPLPLLSPVKQNVDLNLAPPNWLRGSGAGRYFYKTLFSQFNKTSDRNTSHVNPSSIILASHYSHLVGGVVDVIADTKSVKKLLTMPYNKSNVSMSVHRIGRTLLIDELYTDTSLREFEKLSSVGELPKVPLVKKDPVSVRHRSMYSKLLYYSTPDDDSESLPILPAPEHLLTLPDPVKGAAPNIDEELSDIFPCVPPDPLPQPFHLNVEWTVNDIRMLLGSDLPIFGKEGKPAISLKLRDMDKPITVLTGLDYWLDNLMCNVPELAMCYHVDGIVQKFDVIKTEDIPKLDKNCQFSPQEVLKVAENILSFLKSNCTKEGHTYWLFRPKGEDLVKLYDLTTLTSSSKETEAIENPFAKSVATLFYRVSQRMLQYGACDNKKELNNIKILLENCIKLLHNDLNSQIVMSSYFLLADMFLSHTPPLLEEEPTGSEDDDESHESQLITNEPYISSLAVSSLIHNIDPLMTGPADGTGSIPDATNSLKISLTYVSKALEGLNPLCIVDNWRVTGTSQLLLTAGNAYWKLSEGAMADSELGQCLRWARLAVLCFKVSLALSKDKKQIKLMKNMLGSSWQLCGDVHVLSTKASSSLSRYINDFNMFDSIDCKIKTFLSSLYNPSVEEDDYLQLHVDIETSLKMSIECYNVCKSVGGASTNNNKLKERLGNAWNELGVYYKHTAATGTEQDYSAKTSLCDESYKCITKGLTLFKETGSVPNQSLLNANLGSLSRVLAAIEHQKQAKEGGGAEFSLEERSHYNRSIDYYNKGKALLKRLSNHPTIWLNIEMDLCNVYYEFGRAIQDRPPLSRVSVQEVERDIVSLFMKAIHFAESVAGNVPPGSSHHVSVSGIIGTTHQQLGSLYHKVAFDPAFSTQRQRTARTQSERHYSKSINSFIVNDHSLQILRVYWERSLLYEQHANISSGNHSIKLLHQSLDDILLAISPLQVLLKLSSNDTSTSSCSVLGSLKQLLVIIVQRLRTICKQLLTLSMKRTTSVQDDSASCTISQYKRLYELSISDIDIDTDINADSDVNTDSDINTDLLLSDIIKLLENIKVVLS
ncbi:PREDICTED: erythroid differentiation-related factor 1-like isoform X1 [Amphimedon queenslandica]|uniref:Erythroid differentiation-related factor 1 n=1 Tax=Amphimedon queenslandica TaxID=400682 RepID=A0A1X7VMY5_AMPQE|nr:PREDICTED: erythroid differentiation-related factor 1-like isoform X1 [Amphimedon queenslandica]|eukprot:XP_019864437.1 PREDICTED: erythroid differentiation-related factor 1-like isoform X1 [Amphimedon queenslandica]